MLIFQTQQANLIGHENSFACVHTYRCVRPSALFFFFFFATSVEHNKRKSIYLVGDSLKHFFSFHLFILFQESFIHSKLFFFLSFFQHCRIATDPIFFCRLFYTQVQLHLYRYLYSGTHVHHAQMYNNLCPRKRLSVYTFACLYLAPVQYNV